MFQTQGAAAEEDVTEEDGSEERSAKESGKEEIYVRDKKTAPLSKPFVSVVFSELIYCTSFSQYISSRRYIHSTTLTFMRGSVKEIVTLVTWIQMK